MNDDERIDKLVRNAHRLRCRRDYWLGQVVRIAKVVDEFEASDEPRSYAHAYEAIAAIVDQARRERQGL